MNKQIHATSAKETVSVSDDQLMGFIIRNKGILIVGIIIVVLIFAVGFFYVDYSSEKEMAAWNNLNQVVQTNITSASLEEALSSVEGTSAEPWSLYLLSVQYFREGNMSGARTILARLEAEHADHYLLSDPLLVPSFREKLVAELNWIEHHLVTENRSSS